MGSPMNATLGKGQLVAAVASLGSPLTFTFEGVEFQGFEGQSVLAALLQSGKVLRYSEFDGMPRAGFCLMAACQDCWIWTVEGKRLRSCSTVLRQGMELLSAFEAWEQQ